MQTFTDNTDDSWSVGVTYLDVRRVERDCGFVLTAMFDDNMAGLAKLSDDYGLLVAVTHCLCAEQAESRGLDADGFAKRMGGDTLESALKSVVEATIDFFPDPRRREALRELVKRIGRASDKMIETMTPEALAQMDRAIDAMTLEQLSSGLSSSYGSAAES